MSAWWVQAALRELGRAEQRRFVLCDLILHRDVDRGVNTCSAHPVTQLLVFGAFAAAPEGTCDKLHFLEDVAT